ncbi:uncharacterized protein ATNIH1004_006487 [Aspergillus tanneri]|uniref:SUKH-4 immunity protein n=1 Tax=Aspergillus tanneri TaxID=1220188 RepID=A0A5M9MPG1_9EURO|nr:uncharacterized protein ATNIH1004_006487 [Aspergillus tanneri]KAA8647786.1 hypothetical protein ATNIH1004_006487 [Aspergillus tanneri]
MDWLSFRIRSNAIRGATPSQSWLEIQFGAGSLWQPKESDLPAALTEKLSREFLLNVGFPSIKLCRAGFESVHLSKYADEGKKLHEFDSDDLYGRRVPENPQPPPTNFSFHFGDMDNYMVMLDNESGLVSLYDPDGWDHAKGYLGRVAFSLDNLAVLLGMVAAVTKDLREPPSDDVTWEEMERRVEILKRPLDILRKKLEEYDDCIHDDSVFWNELFSHLLDDMDIRN